MSDMLAPAYDPGAPYGNTGRCAFIRPRRVIAS